MPFHIVVVGTGIAGLGAAIALSKKGHRVTMVEATSRLRPIGGIIILQANANRVLDSLGVYQSLLPFCGASPNWASTRRYHDGQCLIKKPAEAHEKAYGLWPLHRADLQQVLYVAAKRRGVAFRLGCPVVGVDETGRSPAALLISDERIHADIIVGADGMALEDAVTLAECLARATTTANIPTLLHIFQEIRQPRCKHVQEWGALKGARAMKSWR